MIYSFYQLERREKIKIQYCCDFEGAEGTCDVCGTRVILEDGDKVLPITWTRNKRDENFEITEETIRIWKVTCPGCKNDLECEKEI